MPIYDYHCAKCDSKFTRFLKMVDYLQPQQHTCGETAVKILSAPMVVVDYPGYVSPATGKWVEGKKAHLQDLKESGCRIFEPGERNDMEKRLKEEDKKLDTFVNDSVEKVYAELKG